MLGRWRFAEQTKASTMIILRGKQNDLGQPKNALYRALTIRCWNCPRQSGERL